MNVPAGRGLTLYPFSVKLMNREPSPRHRPGQGFRARPSREHGSGMGMKAFGFGLVLALGTAGGSAQEKGAPPPLVEAVHALPALAEKKRPQAIRAILRRPDASLEQLLAACRALPKREKRKPGLQEVPPGHLVVPPGYDPTRRWPLLLAVGATGQPSRSAAAGWARLSGGVPLLVLSPRAPEPGRGWTFAAPDREAVVAAWRWALLNLPIDTSRVFLAGISRGGHAAWGLPALHPGIFAGTIPVAGGPRVGWGGGQNNIRYIENMIGIPVFALVGEKDDPMLVWNAREADRRLQVLGGECTLEVRGGAGHALLPDPAKVASWLQGRKRPDPGDKVVLLTLAQRRRSWLRIRNIHARFRRPFKPAFPAARWDSWDRQRRRRAVIDRIIALTPRLEAILVEPGQLRVTGRGVRSFTLLPGPDSPLADAKEVVRVKIGGRTERRRRIRPSRSVLLSEWARLPDPSRLAWDRLDFTFPRR